MTRIELSDDSPVLAALKAIRAEAHRLEAPEHDYPLVSVRSLAGKLGYAELLPSILEACASNGFDYCLDSTIQATSYSGGTKETSFPSQEVCYWGPDQLRSRLDCVDWRLRPQRGA